MPGIIPHLISGSVMFLIGRYSFKSYFDAKNKYNKKKDTLILSAVCISFSILPDFSLGLYYLFGILSFEILLYYHDLVHLMITPIAIAALIILQYLCNLERKPIWIMGFLCIIVHILMDLFIRDTGVLF